MYILQTMGTTFRGGVHLNHTACVERILSLFLSFSFFHYYDIIRCCHRESQVFSRIDISFPMQIFQCDTGCDHGKSENFTV
jgi:hypothetical protein